MRNFFFLIVIFFLLFACTSNTIYKKPDDLIPKKEMIALLTDMYIANSVVNVNTNNKKRNINYMPLVYDKYGIDSLRFHTSNVYYMSRVDDYEAIYIKVEKNLQEMLDTAEISQKIKDSLKRKGKKLMQKK